jgi:cystathionine beta-lyase
VAAIAGVLLVGARERRQRADERQRYEPSRVMAKGPACTARDRDALLRPLDVEGFPACSMRGPSGLLESPGSLTMEVCDVPALAAIAREKGAVSVLDNTWASPLGFPRSSAGCDISLMSLTKHVGGHSDLMMGCAVRRRETYRRLRAKSQALGQVVSPD